MRAFALFFALVFSLCVQAHAEDGYDLWLRYKPVTANRVGPYRNHAAEIDADCSTPTLRATSSELQRGLTGMLGRPIPLRSVPATSARSGAIVLARTGGNALGPEGYAIRSDRIHGNRITVISANSDIGLLYGVFGYLRLIQTGQKVDALNIHDAPKYTLRVLDHWDNLDRTVERGYAGPSLWNWATLPKIDQRYIDYARADASIGINGAVLNNVNADPKILSPEYLTKVAALASAFRPYGVRVYLSVRFSSPVEVGHLKTADPMDPTVQAWWRSEVDQIYRLIPDFGGFVVKANSEGEPGPWDYHRTQADGADVIADALAPHGGTVFWRAFVYSATKEDRAKQAYDEFKPLDGHFRRNVIVQVKNGPIDFQPREPFSPLFGQMPKTHVGLEVQLTREYLGGDDGIVFLAPMWSEVLDSDTCSPRCGTPVKSTVTAMAGVANIGSDRNWTGSQFNQANWYAFGRLAWNPSLSPQQIATEWTRMTWSSNPKAVQPIVATMLNSRESVVDYMTPLGLVHQFQNDHHYGPAPWSCNLSFPSWNPCYYNDANSGGIGFDRTKRGSDAVDQYAPPIAREFGTLRTVPSKYLLFFYHLPWTQRLPGGQSLWDSLIVHYDRGVAQVEANRHQWSALAPYVDRQHFADVSKDLDRQVLEAWWWRDASIAYWQSLSKLPLPPGHSSPAHPLSYYQSIHFDTVPGFKVPRIDARTLCVAGRGGPKCAL